MKWEKEKTGEGEKYPKQTSQKQREICLMVCLTIPAAHTHFLTSLYHQRPLFISQIHYLTVYLGESERETAKWSWNVSQALFEVVSKFSSWKSCQMGIWRQNPSAYPQKRKQEAKLFTSAAAHNHQWRMPVVWANAVESRFTVESLGSQQS